MNTHDQSYFVPVTYKERTKYSFQKTKPYNTNPHNNRAYHTEKTSFILVPLYSM